MNPRALSPFSPCIKGSFQLLETKKLQLFEVGKLGQRPRLEARRIYFG
jgi:hypothetical protein